MCSLDFGREKIDVHGSVMRIADATRRTILNYLPPTKGFVSSDKVFSVSANPLALQSLSQPCCSFSEASAAATSFLARRVRAMRATKTSLVTTPMSLIVIAAITRSILIFTTYETGSWVLLCLRFE